MFNNSHIGVAMRIFLTGCSLFMLFSLCACGSSYRQISTMNQFEVEKVEQSKHDFAKCVVQQALSLDDGKIDPKLIVSSGSNNCDNILKQINFDLKNRHFIPVQVNQYVEGIKEEGERKTLETVLRLRTN